MKNNIKEEATSLIKCLASLNGVWTQVYMSLVKIFGEQKATSLMYGEYDKANDELKKVIYNLLQE